jgi:AcrR family transcriptional regulator
MSSPTDLRTRKRLATRQAISDAATRLFIERGFDKVTIDEIAAAAGVGRMTVFNHFVRKEDMFFDRDEEGRELLRQALTDADPAIPPAEVLRLLAHRLVEEKHPLVDFSARSQSFIEAVEASETLTARARAIRDELAQAMTAALCERAGQAAADPDPEADLAGQLLLATWTSAFLQAHRGFRQSRSRKKAETLFLALVDRGMAGLKAAMAGTPYA